MEDLSIKNIKKYHVERITECINTLTGIPKKKLREYSKNNNLINIIDHVEAGDFKNVQRQKLMLLKRFMASYEILLIENEKEIRIDSPEAAVDVVRSLIGYEKDKEIFLTLYMDSSGKINEVDYSSIGDTTHSYIYPKQILKKAINNGCVSVIFDHNHPSGDPTPSMADENITKKMGRIFEPFEIILQDHIIITPTKYESLRERGIIDSYTGVADYAPIEFRCNKTKKQIFNPEEDTEKNQLSLSLEEKRGQYKSTRSHLLAEKAKLLSQDKTIER